MTLPRRQWADMTAGDFRSKATASWIAVLPIGAVEQHGPHLPLATDAAIAQAHVEAVIARLPDRLPATFLPVLAYGKSNEHVDFPGTLSLSAATLSSVLLDIGESIARAGVKKLVIANSHGGNMAVIDIAIRELRIRHDMLAVHASWHRFGQPAGVFGDAELQHGIHAGDVETSLMLHYRPDLVRIRQARNFRSAGADMDVGYRELRLFHPVSVGWKAGDLNVDGACGNASAATAEKGQRAADFAVEAFVSLLEDVARFPIGKLGSGELV